MKGFEEKNIFIEFDCLHDTRLGTIALIDQDKAVEALHNLFVERYTDDPTAYCHGITLDDYSAKYKARDNTTLRASLPTTFCFRLAPILKELYLKQMAGTPDAGDVTLIINHYPYKFTKEESEECVKALRVYTGPNFPIRMIYKPLNELTTEWINMEKIAVMYLYSFQEWIDSSFNGRTDIPARCPGVTIYAPALARNVQVVKEIHQEFEQMLGRVPDFFAQLKAQCKQFFNIVWVSSAYYSIYPKLLVPQKGA